MTKWLKALCLMLCAIFAIALSACKTEQPGDQTNTPENWEEQNTNCEVFPTRYAGIQKLQSQAEITEFNKQTRNVFPVENGIVLSPYYSLTINGKNVPVYAARTRNGAHSFAYVDVDATDESFTLNTKLTFLELSTVKDDYDQETPVDILPESNGVKAVYQEDGVACIIRDYGSYSFVFNKFHEEALTLMVTPKHDTQSLFGDYETVYFEPGDYSTAEAAPTTLFTEENKVYYFKSGKYLIDSFSLPSNSILYIEQGAYMQIMPSATVRSNSILNVYGKENIKIIGRGLIDVSACCGSANEAETGLYNNKGGYNIVSCDNVTFSGLTTINSQTWTICMTDVENLNVSECLSFAYRVYADGIMLSDCKNAIVENCFVRTGDDAFETKSTSSTGYTDNVLFRNNAAWTDVAVAYGCIYEANHDTRNVRFENCSVGFALGTWSTHLGSCVIQLGNRMDAITEDIVFDGFEIYTSYNPAICSIYTGGSGGAGIGWGHVDDIRFRNITVKYNYGVVLNLRTYDEDSSIKNVYLDNIKNGSTLVTPQNFYSLGLLRNEVKGGYDTESYLHINTEP